MISNLYFDPVTEQEICKIIGAFKNNAAGWDDLNSTMIKHIKESITTPLVHICNRSFETGIFPSELKIANVVPIYKSGDEMVFSNYRPASVLPVFSKLLERLNRLISHINENKLLYEYQFGFQKGKSTYLAIMMLVDKITEALDQGECVVGVFLDFSKAFDTVDNTILLQKLHKYGICGVELLWFEDYLSNRMQYATYNIINHPMKKLIVEYHRVLYWVPYCFYCISMTWEVFQNFVFLYCLLMTLICSLLAKIWMCYVVSLMRMWEIYKNGYSVINYP